MVLADLQIIICLTTGAEVWWQLQFCSLIPDAFIVGVGVTIFPDDNKKYLITDLLRKEPLKDEFLSPDVEFTNYKAFKRVCHTCCDPETCGWFRQ